MTGVVAAAACLKATTGASGDGSGLGSLHWTNIFGHSSGSTNQQTISGLSAPLSITAALTGGAVLYYTKNGVYSSYTGAFSISNGDVLSWAVIDAGGTSGTVTVTNQVMSTTITTFNYVLTGNVS
jgi:hypothetical protein